MATTYCPECGTEIDIDVDLVVGKRIECQGCQTYLEVIWLFPLSLERSDDQFGPRISNSPEYEKDTNE
jgi:hypothetical protein